MDEKAAYEMTNNASLRSREAFDALPKNEQAEIIKKLQKPSLPNQGTAISLIGASRKIANPNHNIALFCQSVLNTTSNLKKIEMVARIDEDDDLLHYLKIQEQFGPVIRMRFVVGPRKGGYRVLHLLVADTLDHLASSSKLVFGFADDCVLERFGWDNEFMQIIPQCPDNILFVNTGRHREMFYVHTQRFFKTLWDGGPPSLFTAVGKRVLQITARVAKKYQGWTAYGNSVMCDSFLETLQMYIWQFTGQLRAPLVPGVIRVRIEKDVIAEHKEGGLFGYSPVARQCFVDFVSTDVQVIVREMAQAIVAEMQGAKVPQHIILAPI